VQSVGPTPEQPLPEQHELTIPRSTLQRHSVKKMIAETAERSGGTRRIQRSTGRCTDLCPVEFGLDPELRVSPLDPARSAIIFS
jgi:hypothetical protein